MSLKKMLCYIVLFPIKAVSWVICTWQECVCQVQCPRGWYLGVMWMKWKLEASSLRSAFNLWLHEYEHLFKFCSLWYLKHLAQCLAHNKCLTNICWMSKWKKKVSLSNTHLSHSHHKEGEVIRDEVTNHYLSPSPRVASPWTGILFLCVGGMGSECQV